VLVEVGSKISFAADPAPTVNAADAPVSPAAVAVIVAFPLVLGVKLELATPAVGETGVLGLNDPVTPLTDNVIAFVAVDTVLPLASRIVAM
jgi:hypothetical protein